METQDNPWRELVEIAARSPSTHNTQGWRIRVESDNGARLFYDTERTLPAEDIDGDFNIINMGIFVRGMQIAAASIGYRLYYDFTLDESNSLPRYVQVAALSLGRGKDPYDSSLLTGFLTRRTSRIPYDGRRIDERDLEQVREWVHAHGHYFAWTQNLEEVRWFLELNADTIAKDLHVRAVRQELHHWMRFTKQQAERERDGLWATCMNQNGALLWYMTKYPKILRINWIKRFFKRNYSKTQAGTPAIGWIEGGIETREEQFEAGRLALDFWIKLTELRIQMLPFGSLYTNPASNKEVGKRTGAPRFWLIFRMGFGQVPPESFRLPPKQLFI